MKRSVTSNEKVYIVASSNRIFLRATIICKRTSYFEQKTGSLQQYQIKKCNSNFFFFSILNYSKHIHEPSQKDWLTVTGPRFKQGNLYKRVNPFFIITSRTLCSFWKTSRDPPPSFQFMKIANHLTRGEYKVLWC